MLYHTEHDPFSSARLWVVFPMFYCWASNGESVFLSQSFVADFASTSREDVFSSPDKVQLLNQVICQHFYRQGMLDIADELAQVMLLLVSLCRRE